VEHQAPSVNSSEQKGYHATGQEAANFEKG